MRIGIEAQRLFRPKKHGIDVVTLELIKALHETDRENEYHIFVKNDADKLCLNLTHSNFKLHILPSLPYPVWEQIYLPNYIKRLNLDVLHCLGNTAPVYCSVPLVVTIHDLIYLESVEMKGTAYQNFGNLYRRFIVPQVAKKAKAVISISHFEKENIAKTLGLKPDVLKVVYNAVGKTFQNQYTEAEYKKVKEEYALPEKFLLFISNPSPRKNTKRAIEAFVKYQVKKVNALPLVVLNGDITIIRDILKQQGKENLVNRIHIPKYVSSAHLPLIYGLASIFLYPSLREGFGLPILEAMACGVPVITSNISAMPEVAGDAAILVNPVSVEEISEALIQLDQDENLKSQLREKGFKRASQFSWIASAKQCVEVYKNV